MLVANSDWLATLPPQIINLRRLNLHDVIARAHLHEARVLTNRAPVDQVIARIETALSWNAKNVECNRKMGLPLLSADRIDRARQYFQAALAVNPYDAPTLVGLALMHLQTNSFEKAALLLESAVRADPQFSQGHHYLGVTLYRLGRDKDALVHIERAVEIDPHFAPSRAALADIRRRLGR